ncbi:hypothetical protein [Pseudaestuariivita rosea]|uniref:hypothetical protein n=1 Tax=Pseudaestuariivita rosea TaxID=2763263 RepID=UPI001ABB3472|nr:hypothetical protein [Pseudaestuariivita rosea]
MNFEAWIITLRHIEGQIKTHTLALKVNDSPDKNTHSYNELIRKLDRWERQLTLMQRDLASQYHNVAYRHGRPKSYPEVQSRKDRLGNVNRLNAQVDDLLDALDKMRNAMGVPNNPNRSLMKGFQKGLKELTKDIDPDDFIQVIGHNPGPAVPAAPPVTGNQITGGIVLAVAAIAAIKRYLSGRSRKDDAA